ncbi:MAG: DUF1684 domain-containing protein [Actinomycetota bacterium]
MEDVLSLLDWKRRVFSLYAQVRAEPSPQKAWKAWRAGRDELFAQHPQSPLPEHLREDFQGLDYFDYDRQARVLATFRPSTRPDVEMANSDRGTTRFQRVGIAEFELHGRSAELELYWLDAYGGGLFLPFRDATAGKTSYGAGRYVLDTVKGADLGSEDGRLVLDFNFAYQPSCSYDAGWSCPLAPAPNHLSLAIEAGEKL